MSGYTNYSNYNQNIISSNSNNTGRHRNPTIMLYSNIATNLNKLDITSWINSHPNKNKLSRIIDRNKQKL
jgi:hypothetical protein